MENMYIRRQDANVELSDTTQPPVIHQVLNKAHVVSIRFVPFALCI